MTVRNIWEVEPDDHGIRFDRSCVGVGSGAGCGYGEGVGGTSSAGETRLA